MQVLLVAIKLNNQSYFEETLEECKNLCDAAGYQIINTMVQSANSLDPNTALRKGKLEELMKLLEEKEVDQVVFYNNLPTRTVANLKDYLGVEVIDRTSLILNIFSLRARSKEAQIQTEIARLKYDMPQLLKDNMNQDKQRGGAFNNRGAGETRSDIIRRKMEGRIHDLKVELEKLEERKETEYQKRGKSELKKVALVGYTNAGKSSLMNVLLSLNDKEEKSVLEKDQLFATLDTSIRSIHYQKHEFLLFDTVGFVSDLPHGLIEAFKSTLKAASYADLLVHVVDASNPDYPLHQKVTLDTLKEIGAEGIPMINVYNKSDRLEERDPERLDISCKTGEGIDLLLKKIDEALYPREESVTLTIPYSKLYLVNQYQGSVQFEKLEDNENGSVYQISGSQESIERLKKNLF